VMRNAPNTTIRAWCFHAGLGNLFVGQFDLNIDSWGGWKAIHGAGDGGAVQKQIYQSSNTFWPAKSGLHTFILVGAGGSGGFGPIATSNPAASSGSAGALLTISAMLNVGDAVPITIGAGGGARSSKGEGYGGGNTKATIKNILFYAGGGGGGAGYAGNTDANTSRGTSTGGSAGMNFEVVPQNGRFDAGTNSLLGGAGGGNSGWGRGMDEVINWLGATNWQLIPGTGYSIEGIACGAGSAGSAGTTSAGQNGLAVVYY